jgi:hypothetical protein
MCKEVRKKEKRKSYIIYITQKEDKEGGTYEGVYWNKLGAIGIRYLYEFLF